MRTDYTERELMRLTQPEKTWFDEAIQRRVVNS
jgi:hypothetical protein